MTELNSNQEKEVTDYLKYRYIQAESILGNIDGGILIRNKEFQILMFNQHSYEIDKYAAVYLYKDFRTKGKYKEICDKLNKADYEIYTTDECNLVDYFRYKKIDYFCLTVPDEYKIISKYYKDKRAKRTGIPYINHIHEGCLLINDDLEKLAFMLHPIFQDGVESMFDLSNIDLKVINLAKKYTKIANSYLPKDYEKSPVKTRNFWDVRQMLIADKVQNYKDYRQNKEVFPKEKQNQLETYFKKWFKLLGVDGCLEQNIRYLSNLNIEVL